MSLADPLEPGAAGDANMYRYDEFDRAMVLERVREFRGQVERRLNGQLTEDQFKPLRLMNGLYLQLHAYMLRVAVPYGTLSARQLRRLAEIARKYDKGYGHFTTRQNIQYNWPKLEDVPDLLEDLAEVEMHAIQTSGNCIRNVTSDHYAGAAADEIEDPRIISEVIRQWSTFHPEFSFLPRKFKIAVTASPHDRAAVKVHDIGIEVRRNEAGEVGYRVYVGGGQGRTPFIAKCVGDFIPRAELLSYLEAVMRVYNRAGRRDNLFKARIKILVHEMGEEAFRNAVEEEYAALKSDMPVALPEEEVARIAAYFAPPAFEDLPARDEAFEQAREKDADFAHWVAANTYDHKQAGYRIVNVSLKPIGGVPGDATSEQMEIVAELAERFGFHEIRVTHEQNLTLPHIPIKDLYTVYQTLRAAGLATANINKITDMIACPGLDYCNLANARSINIAQAISERFADIERQHTIGELKINISGCINACGHHHVGHIGILGVDKKGTEYYQISLGGAADESAALAKIIGPAFEEHEVPGAIETLVGVYLNTRAGEERFIDTYRRLGPGPFKEALYADH